MNEPYWIPGARHYPRLWRRLLRWLQRKCQHRDMVADVLEGRGGWYEAAWCNTCGAVWLRGGGGSCSPIRMPEPTWGATKDYPPLDCYDAPPVRYAPGVDPDPLP